MRLELPKPWKNITKKDLDYSTILSGVRSSSEVIYVGNGSDSIVVTLPDKKEVVVAYTFENSFPDKGGFWTPEKAKRMFYINQILTTLFPNNFPKLHFVIGRPRRNFIRRFFEQVNPFKRPELFGSIRERVIGSGGVKRGAEYPFSRVLTLLSTMGISKPEVFFDDKEYVRDIKHANIITTEEGKEYYVDVIDKSRFGDPRHFDQELIDKEKQILDYMRASYYTEHEVNHVKKIIKRLGELRK